MPDSTADQHTARFLNDGFLPVGRLADESDLRELRGIYDDIVAAEFGDPPDRIMTTIPGSENALFTVLSPQSIRPELSSSAFASQANALAAHLFGTDSDNLLAGWRFFFKPPGCVETAWHQDAAYRPPPHSSMSIWLTLDAATRASGCMHYIRGSHHEDLKPHHTHNGHLVTDDVDLTREVVVPAEPGSAIVHHCRTLHCASPNESNRSRRAIVIVYQVARDTNSGNEK